jgi:hypothetical protein
MNKDRIKEISIGVLAVFMYFFLNSIQYVPFQLAGVTTDLLPTWVKIFYLIIYEIMTIAIMLLIFNKKITKDFKDMLINHKEYYSKYFKYYLIGLGIMLISNSIIVYVFDGGISTNEETIRDIFKISPLYIYFSSVIYAPIVEELTFRQGIRNIFGRNILFVLISGFLFGGLHVITSINSIVDLLYIIPYSSLGIVFAYILYKTDNIFVSMGLHFMHNGILIAIQFLVLIFS